MRKVSWRIPKDKWDSAHWGGGVTSKFILRRSEGKEVSGSGNSDENIGRRVVRDEAS